MRDGFLSILDRFHDEGARVLRRRSFDSSAESTTLNLSEISQTHQHSALAPGQVDRQSKGQRQRYQYPQIRRKTCTNKLYIFK